MAMNENVSLSTMALNENASLSTMTLNENASLSTMALNENASLSTMALSNLERKWNEAGVTFPVDYELVLTNMFNE